MNAVQRGWAALVCVLNGYLAPTPHMRCVPLAAEALGCVQGQPCCYPQRSSLAPDGSGPRCCHSPRACPPARPRPAVLRKLAAPQPTTAGGSTPAAALAGGCQAAGGWRAGGAPQLPEECYARQTAAPSILPPTSCCMYMRPPRIGSGWKRLELCIKYKATKAT